MNWTLSHRADPKACRVADRHYNRQKVGSPQCAPPGRAFVLYAKQEGREAFWITSWPFAEYVKHAWAGAWVCSAFRNETALRATDLIRQALAASRHHYGDPPPLGMVTFLDRKKVRPIKVRGVPTWGRTWALAGFKHVGWTAGGLMAWQLLPGDFPPAEPPQPFLLPLWEQAA
jgi:hypothetical protein